MLPWQHLMADTLGDRIKRARRAKHLTQAQLAAKLLVDRSLVSRWETGGHHPGGDNLRKIADALDVTVVWLTRGDEDATETPLQKVMRAATLLWEAIGEWEADGGIPVVNASTPKLPDGAAPFDDEAADAAEDELGELPGQPGEGKGPSGKPKAPRKRGHG